jgi:hypothetical protein
VKEVRGDFNGDGIEDGAFVIRSSSFPPNFPPDIQITWPFQKSPKRSDPRKGPPVSLVFVNAGPYFPTATVVVLDEEPNGRLSKAVELGIRLLKKAEVVATSVAQLAKGDVLVLPGRDGKEDCFYWDGTAFKLAPLG